MLALTSQAALGRLRCAVSKAVLPAIMPAVPPAVGDGLMMPQTLSLIARMSTKPSAGRAALIDSTIRRLISAGLWSKLVGLHVYAAHASDAAILNWVANNSAAPVNSPTFTTDLGYTGNGTSSYLNTQLEQTLVAQDNNALGVYLNTNVGTSSVAFGAPSQFIRPRSSSNTCDVRSSATTNDSTGATVTTSVGLTSIGRSVSTGYKVYKNGVELASFTRASAAPAAGRSMYTLAFNNSGTASNFSSQRVAMDFMASSAFTDEEHATFYTIMLAYLTAVGAS